MKNIDELFEDLPEKYAFSPELQGLLDNIMSIKNPMDFDESFATNEQLDALEDELDRLESRMPELHKVIAIIRNTKATESDKPSFI